MINEIILIAMYSMDGVGWAIATLEDSGKCRLWSMVDGGVSVSRQTIADKLWEEFTTTLDAMTAQGAFNRALELYIISNDRQTAKAIDERFKDVMTTLNAEIPYADGEVIREVKKNMILETVVGKPGITYGTPIGWHMRNVDQSRLTARWDINTTLSSASRRPVNPIMIRDVISTGRMAIAKALLPDVTAMLKNTDQGGVKLELLRVVSEEIEVVGA